MPNIGRPSRDCHECRRRRVKCDLKRPGCDRCAKIHKDCPGYRDETDLMFKHTVFAPADSQDGQSTRTSSGRSSGQQSAEQRPSPPVSSLPNLTGQDLPSSWTTEPLLLELDYFVLEPGRPSSFNNPDVDWSVHCTPLVLSMFSSGLGQPRVWGHFQILPQLLVSSETTDSLRHTCAAIGLAYVNNRFKRSDLEALRDNAYGKALMAIKHQIGDATLAPKDETTLSIYLLSMFELIVGESKLIHKAAKLTWNIHANAQIELLRVRGPAQLENPISRHTFWLMTHAISMKAVVQGVAYPDIVDELVSIIAETKGADEGDCIASNFASAAAYINKTTQDTSYILSLEGALPLLHNMQARIQKLEATSQEVLDRFWGETVTDPYMVNTGNRVAACYVKTLFRMLTYITKVREAAFEEDTSELDALVATYTNRVQTLLDHMIDEILGMMAANGHLDLLDLRLDVAPMRLYDRLLCWKDHLFAMGLMRLVRSHPQHVRSGQMELLDTMLNVLGERYHMKQALVPRYEP